MASLTSKDAIYKEVRDCVNTGNEDRCRQINPYIHCYWKDLHVKNGCVCVEDRITIPNSIKDAYVEAIHATHPGRWEMTDMAVHAWWPFMHRDFLSKTAKCNPCGTIGRNLKSIKPSSKWAALKLCKVLNEEIQIDFGGKKSRGLYPCLYRPFLKISNSTYIRQSKCTKYIEVSSKLRIIAWNSSSDKHSVQSVSNLKLFVIKIIYSLLRLQYTITERFVSLEAYSNNQESISLN